YQLDRLGLSQAIRAIVTRAAENSQISFASHVDDVDGLFNQESDIHVYRIVQESINNVLKHSGATEAAVVVKRQGETVSVSIRDNGRGFDTNLPPQNGRHESGFGLNGINERARILRGKVTINSRPGQGTNVSVELPILVHET